MLANNQHRKGRNLTLRISKIFFNNLRVAQRLDEDRKRLHPVHEEGHQLVGVDAQQDFPRRGADRCRDLPHARVEQRGQHPRAAGLIRY